MTRKNNAGFKGVEVSNGASVLKKGPWSPQEDALLIKYVNIEGERNWKNVQKTGLMRCGKSCRLRWTNHLHPELKKGNFSSEEEKIVIQMHEKVGNRWSKIAAQLPGRTDNEVKNFWNTKIKKRMMSDSSKTYEENLLPKQNSPTLNVRSFSPLMSSPTTIFSLQTPKMNSNSSNLSINPKPTFSITHSNELPRLNLLRSSKMHEDPTISFAKDSTSLSNMFKNPSIKNFPNTNPFPRNCVLEFASGSTYHYPIPFSLSCEHSQASLMDFNNYYNEGFSTMEGAPNKYSHEVEMDDELLSLINSFNSNDSSPKLHVPNEGENSNSSYRVHFYLDQKLSFPSFSKARASGDATLGSDSPCAYSSNLSECFDVEDWIIAPESC